MNQAQQQQNTEYSYMLLGRYQMDLDYFFGWGHQNEKFLFFLDIKEHIEETRKLWDSLAEKPEWFTEDQLMDFEKRCSQLTG